MKSFSGKDADLEERLLNIAAANDEFEAYKNPHAARIAAIAEAIGRKFNLASHDNFSIRQAALVHDIGEVLMNREYVAAKRSLREDELLDIQRHSVIGEQEAAKRGLNRAVQLIVRWHHEWWNGTGYPDALTGEQIPLAARILRVADTYAAMTDYRPFRDALPETDAKKYLVEWAGIEFDPQVVKAFLSIENPAVLKSYAGTKPAREEYVESSYSSSIFSVS